jgi:hypothetical protein
MHIHVELDSQNHHIVANGSVISFNEDPLTLSIPLEGEDLSFIFSFKSDLTDASKPYVKVIPLSGKSLELQLVNFDFELGMGNIDPIEVGALNNQGLFLNYRIYALADSPCRLLHYTFYQEKAHAHS